MELEEQTKLEKLMGSLPYSLVATAIGALGGISGALLPVFSNSLAHKRHSDRVERAIDEILLMLDSHREKLENLSDSQYKIILESINYIHKTVDDRKIEFLKKAIKNTLNNEELKGEECEKASRIIGNISSGEAKFLVEKSLNGNQFEQILLLSDKPSPKSGTSRSDSSGRHYASLSMTFVNPNDFVKDKTLSIRSSSDTNQIIYDLQTLGLLRNSKTNDKGIYYKFTPIAHIISNLLK